MTRTSTTLRFGLMPTTANGFLDAYTYIAPGRGVRQRANRQRHLLRAQHESGDLVYLPVATTGNLMRLVESGYTGFVDHDATARQAFTTYGALTLFFTGGALAGAFATHAWHVHAIWIPAAVLFVTLTLFIVDERRGIEP